MKKIPLRFFGLAALAVLLSGCTVKTEEVRRDSAAKEAELNFYSDQQKAAAGQPPAGQAPPASPPGQTPPSQSSLTPPPPMNQNPNAKSYAQAPDMTIRADKQYLATLNTDQGKIVIELNAEKTPITANNFVFLAREKFYDNTIFHRVIDGFMIQGGDPQGTGSGGPGYKFTDEQFEGEYERGTVAMANSGPDTNGSQFFIMHQTMALSPNYVIFGKVTEGMEVVDKIATAPVSAGRSGEKSTPVTPVRIISATVEERE